MELLPAPITDRINLPGSVEPWTRLKLMAKINGTVTEVLLEEGDRVKKGDVIARIEDDDYRIALTRAEAAYRLAESEYQRDKSIFDKGVIPASTLEINRTSMKTARADYENAKLMLSRTSVLSPMDGIITSMDAEVGLQLSVGDPIAVLLETDRMKGIIGIPESDVTAVRQLESVDITIQALGDKRITATKHFLSPAPSTAARLYDLELAIENPVGEVLSGMFLRADVVKERVEDAIAVPFYSVISRNDQQYVFIEEDGVAKRRDVRLGIMEGWLVQVVEGLVAGDRIVIEGHRDLEDGQRIKVVRNFASGEELPL
jgi:membrane fusion protein (multidrug efflux system)